MERDEPRGNPLGSEKISRLILRFAIPAVVSSLVGALYNIVDQIFIGQGVGLLGNAATNVAFPLSTICVATTLLIGVGSAANFNLSLGRGDKDRAAHIAGNGISLLLIGGLSVGLLAAVFLRPLLAAFGATDAVLPYAVTYTRITSLGFPLLIFSTGGSQLIRADGSPAYSMICTLSGAILNTILDPVFIFVFQWGMAGAAYATVLGQFVAAVLVARYLLRRFKTVKLSRETMRPKLRYVKSILSLGAGACTNQTAMMVVQVALNNILTRYGGQSLYGSEIPLACAGVITKVNVVLISIVVGIGQGSQPIFGFNYGAKNYDRVKETYFKALTAATLLSATAFVCFQLFPRQIVGIFGSGSEEYFVFAERYFRIYMFMVFANGLQPLSFNFFNSIGKAKKGMMISLTRQILFLLPLIVVFPMFFGIDGVMYAGPIADSAAALLSFILISRELREMTGLQKKGL